MYKWYEYIREFLLLEIYLTALLGYVFFVRK